MSKSGCLASAPRSAVCVPIDIEYGTIINGIAKQGRGRKTVDTLSQKWYFYNV